MNIFPKAYFIDPAIQEMQEILHNIQKMHRNDYIIIRKINNTTSIKKIIQLAKYKHVTVFSNIQNHDIKNNLHYASSKSKAKTSHKQASISFHTSYDLKRLRAFKPNIVFISPIFHTQTHPSVKPLGKIQTFKVILQIKQLSSHTKVFLLGGMTKKRFFSLKKLDFKNILSGYAGIRGIL